nr:hypothetical protein [Deltaproteobacteria bacterium]
MATVSRRVLLPLIALSSPLSLAVETAIRTALFTDEMRELRLMARDTLTPIAWWFVPVTAAASVLGVFVHRAVLRRALERAARREGDPDAEENARVTALYVASSVPQLPALVATFLFTAGARVEPVMVTLLVAAAGVMLQGWTTPREGEGAGGAGGGGRRCGGAAVGFAPGPGRGLGRGWRGSAQGVSERVQWMGTVIRSPRRVRPGSCPGSQRVRTDAADAQSHTASPGQRPAE